jgi:hypothetical protein
MHSIGGAKGFYECLIKVQKEYCSIQKCEECTNYLYVMKEQTKIDSSTFFV